MNNTVNDEMIAVDPDIVEVMLENKKDAAKVCFVCTGNTCRSPMAEAYMRHIGYKATFSRGIAAVTGDPITRFAVMALRNAGVFPTSDNDYEAHTATRLSADDVKASDVIIAMTERNAVSVLLAYPQYADKIRMMKYSIEDPYGGSLFDYERALAAIIDGIDDMFLRDGKDRNSGKNGG